MSVELDRDIEVLGVQEDLALMVRNLLENALVYTAEGSIKVTTGRRRGRQFELRVADTGAGIPTSDLERIFERFYRVDKARSRDTGGTGLGLAIVRHVAESHGGVVEVASELGLRLDLHGSPPVPGLSPDWRRSYSWLQVMPSFSGPLLQRSEMNPSMALVFSSSHCCMCLHDARAMGFSISGVRDGDDTVDE